MDIKVGQIYKDKEGILMCITKINNNGTYSYILNNGYTGYGCCGVDGYLIGKFESWKKAVNSRMFEV